MQLSLLLVFEWPAVIGVEESTGEGDDEIDSVLRDSVRHSGPSRTPSEPRKPIFIKNNCGRTIDTLNSSPKGPYQLSKELF